MSDHTVRQVVLSTDDLDESIRFYTETLGFTLKFRDGTHYAALDGGSITIALATAIDHPLPGKVVVGIRTDDVDGAVKSIEANGGAIVRAPYDDAHERRAVVYDNPGTGLVFYMSLCARRAGWLCRPGRRGPQPAWMWGRRRRSGSARRSTSRVIGATSPAPKRRKRSRCTIGLPSVHPK